MDCGNAADTTLPADTFVPDPFGVAHLSEKIAAARAEETGLLPGHHGFTLGRGRPWPAAAAATPATSDSAGVGKRAIPVAQKPSTPSKYFNEYKIVPGWGLLSSTCQLNVSAFGGTRGI